MPARVDTTVLIPEFSEFPFSHLNENLYNGFVAGSYNCLGSRILEDHIGYPVPSLGAFSRINVACPDLEEGATISHWSANLLIRPNTDAGE
eukprot:jgi/Tetstr1/435852/TSEL_024740.t1